MDNFYKIVNLIVGLLPTNIPFSGPFSQKKNYIWAWDQGVFDSKNLNKWLRIQADQRDF